MIFDKGNQCIQFSCFVSIDQRMQQIIPHNKERIVLFRHSVTKTWVSIVPEGNIRQRSSWLWLYFAGWKHYLVNPSIRARQCPSSIKQFWHKLIFTQFHIGNTLTIRITELRQTFMGMQSLNINPKLICNAMRRDQNFGNEKLKTESNPLLATESFA